jgi:perosamine synthetase
VKNNSELIPWWRINFSEDDIEKVSESIRNEKMSMGSVTEEFEHRMGEELGVPYVVATSSGSIALLMSMMALGLKSGDEVIIPNRTWIATAHAPMMLGAKPILVDVLPDRPIMDTSLIKEKINSRTKAIIPVQLCGCAVNMDEVWEIAEEYNLAVVEDTAQGLFSKYNGKYMGTQSDIGCFSMAVSKLVSTGQGGFAVTRDKKIYEQMKLLRTHGVANVNAATPFASMGFNFRYTDIHASIGLVQLKKVNERIESLINIYIKYRNGLAELNFLKLIPVDIENGEIPLYIEVLVENRQKLVNHLLQNNIQTRLFYPDLDSAIHLECSGDFPNAHLFGRQGLVLPSGPDQSPKNIERTLKALESFVFIK